MGDLNDAQRAWLKAVGADVDVVERPATAKQPASRAPTMSAASVNAGDSGDGSDGGGGDDGSDGKDGKGAKDSKDDGKGGKTGGKGSGPGGGSGDGGSNITTNEDRIEQLKQWEKQGRIPKGSSKELRDQLADKRDKVLQKRAGQRFNEIRDSLDHGGKPDTGPATRHVPSPADGTHVDPDARPGSSRGGPKEPLEVLLRRQGLNEKEIQDFGNWLKERHRKVKSGKEHSLDSKKRPPDEHEHMYTPDEVEALIRENESEHGRLLGNRKKPDGGGGGTGNKGTGGGGGEGTGSHEAVGGKDGTGAKEGSGSTAASGDKHGGGKGEVGASHETGTGTPHTDGGGGKPGAAPKVDMSKAEAFARQVDELVKLSKTSQPDTEKLEKQSAKLENDGEALARELQTSPELKGFSGSRAKEFFAGVHAKYGSVRASAAGIIVLALNLSDAYALLNEVRSILASKTLREGLEKSFALGKNLVKGQIEFGALRFVFRSTPVAIGIQVFLGDMDMNLGLGPKGKFNQEVAALVNKVRPGSVAPAGHDDELTSFKDGDAKTLFMEAEAEAIVALKQEIASGLEGYGYDDGLVGRKPKAKFEISKMESEVLGIDLAWFAVQYGRGLARGEADQTKVIGRVAQAAQKDGKEGKGFRFEALYEWPEIAASLNGGTAFEAYKGTYDANYREARAGFDTRTVTKFKLSAGGGEAHAEKYGQLSLLAELEYSNGTQGAISQEVEWSVDQPSVATVAYDAGAKITRAHLVGAGKVKITGRLVSGDKTFVDAMTVDVSPPKIRIVPALAGKYYVGLELQLTARTESWPAIPADAITWSSAPPGIVKIDQNGKVVMLKPGKVEISVTEKTKSKPARASASIKIVPEQ